MDFVAHPNFTLLDLEQVIGNKSLKALQKFGSQAVPTELALLLGCDADETETTVGCGVEKVACPFWLKTRAPASNVCAIDSEGKPWKYASPRERMLAIRPVLPASEVAKIPLNQFRTRQVQNQTIVKYGEYPQSITDEISANQLEIMFQKKALKETGKIYTLDSTDIMAERKSFQAISHKEYIYEGQKYIRVLGRADHGVPLRFGERIELDKPYWVFVQPVEWLVDQEGGWIAQNGLISGIQFDTSKVYNGDFEKTFIKHYLDHYFAQQILPTKSYLMLQQNQMLHTEKNTESQSGENMKSRLQKASDLSELDMARLAYEQAQESLLKPGGDYLTKRIIRDMAKSRYLTLQSQSRQK